MTYYDRDGQRIGGVLEWARLFETADRVVRSDYIGDGDDAVHVSTVWLGLDHNWMPTGPPLIFETMIFGGPFDGEQWRYSTEDEAIKGHEHALALTRETQEDR